MTMRDRAIAQLTSMIDNHEIAMEFVDYLIDEGWSTPPEPIPGVKIVYDTENNVYFRVTDSTDWEPISDEEAHAAIEAEDASGSTSDLGRKE